MLKSVLWFLMGLLLFGTPVFADEVDLNFISLLNGNHPTTKAVTNPWIEEMANQTNGTLKIFRYDVNTLCPIRETWDATVNGLTDIGSNTTADNPGIFPLHSVMELPLISHGARVTTSTALDLANKYPEWRDEMKDIHLLWYNASPSFTIHTSKKPVRTLEDMKGLRLLVWNPTCQEIVSQLGATPIMISPTDTYLSLQRGMADGVVAPTATLRSWKLDEVTKYHNLADLSGNLFWFGMNKDRWNSLTDEQKKALSDSSVPMAQKSSEAQDILGSKADLDYVAAHGHEIITPSPEEIVRWQKALQPIYDKWLADMAKRGIDVASQVLEDAKALAQEHYERLQSAK